jgi:hypothetical protein
MNGGIDPDAELLEDGKVRIRDPEPAGAIRDRPAPHPTLEQVHAEVEDTAEDVRISNSAPGEPRNPAVRRPLEVLWMQMQLDLVAAPGDRLDRTLQRPPAILELHQHVDEEGAPETEVLEQVHLQADAARRGPVAEISKDELVDDAVETGPQLAQNRTLGVDGEHQEQAGRVVDRQR